MKKRLIALASIIMAVILSVASFSGCSLVTTDDERDMNQTVATVRISDEFETDVIKKSDMILAYLNYGYMYEQSYGYSREDTFEMIINNLVNTRVLVQAVIKDKMTDTLKSNEAKDYLTDAQKRDAEYDTLKYLNDLVESYEEGEDALKADTFIGTVRTIPTGATNATKKVTDSDKTNYLADAKNSLVLSAKMEGCKHSRDAFNGVVKLLKNNSLLGDYDGKDLKTTEYYKQTLKNNYESQLLTAYEEELTEKVIAEFDFNTLNAKYGEIYTQQSKWTAKDFESAIASTTATDPIVYSAFGGYGYVYNLLLGVNDIQTAEISKIKEENPNISKADYATKRNDILADTVIKDLRSSWALSGYDMEYDADKQEWKFTGDYTFAENAENSLPFGGKVTHLNAEDKDEEDYKAKYSVTDVYSYDLDGFISMMNKYLAKSETPAINSNDYVGNSASSIYNGKIYTFANNVEEYDNKIQELLFAFSTDSGSLNNKNGYNIKPPVDGNNSEQYVETFAEAGRKLLEAGGQSYVIVASDYGYHVMFFSKVLDGINTPDLVTYLNQNLGLGDKNADEWKEYWNTMMSNYGDEDEMEVYEDNYLYTLTNSLISSSITKSLNEDQGKKINAYRYESEGKVTVDKSVYADLLG